MIEGKLLKSVISVELLVPETPLKLIVYAIPSELSGVTNDLFTLPTVDIDHDGPASYPDKPKTRVTKS